MYKTLCRVHTPFPILYVGTAHPSLETAQRKAWAVYASLMPSVVFVNIIGIVLDRD